MVMKQALPVLVLLKMFSVKRSGIFGLSGEVSKEAGCYRDYEEKKNF